MAAAANSVLTILSLLIGLFFMFCGLIKLTPVMNEHVYRELRKEFVRHARVFPLAQTFAVKVDPTLYCTAIGVVEAVAGLMLAFLPGCAKLPANIVLLVIMIGAVYSLNALHETWLKMIPAIVTGFLLVVRLVLYRSVHSTGTKQQKRSHKTN